MDSVWWIGLYIGFYFLLAEDRILERFLSFLGLQMEGKKITKAKHFDSRIFDELYDAITCFYYFAVPWAHHSIKYWYPYRSINELLAATEKYFILCLT